ncbi:MAG: hypothetical protein [Wendovervirus sonii]|uniref:DUF1566 domain-containing protein n=1 Tax=phage Lak_Megaphage_Sonny TaxID=3109229 RepID=A0ABZ0Z207_9CAUD|nr:MAG: hypothetical protein [phage Lak_Megaphage_Sonny]
MNLYNKIYEAINIGIQKALVLDDEDDVSIIYQHKKIINNSNVISYLVDDLLNETDNEYNYEQIIKYYEETGYTYKVKDFNELRNIFDKIKNIENVSFEWISNMKDYISIVLEDKSEINFYEKTDKKALFLKFVNDDILGTENEILIYLYKKHYIPKEVYQWQTKYVQIQPAECCTNDENIANKNYSGYENCLRIQDIVSKEPKKYGKTPAIDQCLNLNDIKGYQGYLPSMGQLRIMSDNIDLINYIFKYLKLNEIKDFNDGHLCDWWSSTEYSYYFSWFLCNDNTSGTNKVNDIHIFPLFAVKKN